MEIKKLSEFLNESKGDKKYLLKIQFDCNDADYVYGCQIIDEKLKNIIDKNKNKKVCFGSYDFGGGNSRSVSSSMSYKEISNEEAAVLKKLGLDSFGETWYGEFSDDEDDEDEDDEDDEK